MDPPMKSGESGAERRAPKASPGLLSACLRRVLAGKITDSLRGPLLMINFEETLVFSHLDTPLLIF